MKLEDQVCSLELSKRLKELCVKQESIFWWIHSSWHPAEGEPWELGSKDDFPGAGTQSTDCSAFTVAELGEMLPKYSIGFYKEEKLWRVGCDTAYIKYRLTGVGGNSYAPENFYAETEADARAKMLIYLIENGLVKP